MQVDLTPDQHAFIRAAMASGRFDREEDAIREALIQWEQRERRRADILTAIDEAEASLAAGVGRPLTAESVQELADSVKQRGRARLAADGSSIR